MAEPPVIYWYRADLRTTDLPGLAAAAATGQPLVACFVLDAAAHGSASRWWLHHSLAALGEELRALGVELVLRSGDSAQELLRLVNETGASAV